MRTRWAILAVTALTSACTYATLSARGQNVNVTEAAPPGCQNLGVVIGKGGGGFGQFVPNESLVQYAINDARNKAAEMGATHVTLSPPQLGGDKNGTSSATVTVLAYRCGEASSPPGALAVPASTPGR